MLLKTRLNRKIIYIVTTTKSTEKKNTFILLGCQICYYYYRECEIFYVRVPVKKCIVLYVHDGVYYTLSYGFFLYVHIIR